MISAAAIKASGYKFKVAREYGAHVDYAIELNGACYGTLTCSVYQVADDVEWHLETIADGRHYLPSGIGWCTAIEYAVSLIEGADIDDIFGHKWAPLY
tara:strand:+ start:4038 stop:4331 length:294 start_codon:yes stop_codon:yes gene_type:complete